MPWGTQGFVPYTAQQSLDVVNTSYVSVFGASVNLSPSSVNGQLIYQESTWLLNNENFINSMLTNVFNPNLASGIYLDTICSFLGIKRKPATFSIVTCICYGSAGTIIVAGTQIANTNNDVFISVNNLTIDGTGQVTGQFIAQQSGAIPCLSNTVNNIINKVYGWDRVNNPTDGVTGSAIQSDFSLRAQLSTLLASFGSASLAAIYAGLWATKDVASVFVAENNTEDDITVAGIVIPPTAIYACVLGGTDADVANSLYKKKCPGIGMVGNTTYDITTKWDTIWTARFQRPTNTPLQINITVGNSTALPANIADLVKTAVYNNFYGIDNNVPTALRVKINELINTSRFVPSLLFIGAYDILVNQIGLVGGSMGQYIQLNADLIATLSTDNINVTLV